MKKLIADLADTQAALENCQNKGNTEWAERWRKRLDKLVNMLPSGSGFDAGTVLTSLSQEKAVFFTHYHHMNDIGYYVGWTDHVVTVIPLLNGSLGVKVSGRNRDNIKELIEDVFLHTLTKEVDPGEIDGDDVAREGDYNPKIKLNIYPNESGATFEHEGEIFEIWKHGGVARCEKDNSPSGFSRVRYAQVDRNGSLMDIANRAILSWRTHKEAWQPCS